MSHKLTLGNYHHTLDCNADKLFHQCYPENGIRQHLGMTGEASIPVLRTLRDYIEDNRESDVAMGLSIGTFDSALMFVNDLIISAFNNYYEVWED